MIKVKMFSSSEIKVVTPNEAHALIESGKAELFKEKQSYATRQMTASREVAPAKPKKEVEKKKRKYTIKRK